MLKTLIGPDVFRQGMDLYFERWDGHATTVEEFIRCFAEASAATCRPSSLYEQAGTPRVTPASRYDEPRGTSDRAQQTPADPGQPTSAAADPVTSACSTTRAAPGLRARRRGRGRDRGRLDGARTHLTARRRRSPCRLGLRGFSAPVVLRRRRAKDRYLAAGDPTSSTAGSRPGWPRPDPRPRRRPPDEVGEERYAEAVRPRTERPVPPTGVPRRSSWRSPTEPDLSWP
jgi:aminopeptidase N